MAQLFRSIVVIGVTLLSGCALPYAIPVIDNGGAAGRPEGFAGLRSVLDNGDTRVFWVHGMCRQDDRWAVARQKALVAALNVDGATEIEVSRTGPRVVPFQVDVTENTTLTTLFAIWSPFTEPAKDSLAFDKPTRDGGEFTYERARFNNELKVGLLNDCLIDAVV
jgi:hypothetical protein